MSDVGWSVKAECSLYELIVTQGFMIIVTFAGFQAIIINMDLNLRQTLLSLRSDNDNHDQLSSILIRMYLTTSSITSFHSHTINRQYINKLIYCCDSG